MIDWVELGDVSVRLVIAVVIGGLIGVERGLHGRWADLRTHILVTLGATIFTIAGVGIAGDSSADATRVVQGIAAGIGFLGAGTILKLSGELEVKGLTTATSVWLSAALGSCVGLKMYELVLAATVVSLLVLYLVRPLDKWFSRRNDPD